MAEIDAKCTEPVDLPGCAAREGAPGETSANLKIEIGLQASPSMTLAINIAVHGPRKIIVNGGSEG